MNLMIVIIGVAALLFIYAAVKGQDPRDIIKGALSRGKK